MVLMTVLATALICIVSAFFLGYQFSTYYKAHWLTTEEALKKSQQSVENVRGEMQVMQAKLQSTYKDPVSQVDGWQIFEDRLTQAVKEVERYNTPLAVLFVDVDNFRTINEALGYEKGNALLQEVAKRIKTCVRQVDSVSRIANDTFTVLLTQLMKPETAAIVAQRILQTISEPLQLMGQDLSITVCIGIAICPEDGRDASTLLYNAEAALRVAKEKGSHLYQFYQQTLHDKSKRELVVNSRLTQDSIFKEFKLLYSPIVNANNKIVSMEVSLNWHEKEVGSVTQTDLFQYAQRQRKLNLVLEWILKTAGKQFLQWNKSNFKLDSVVVPVTIKQFENTHFIYRISKLLQEINFDPHSLIIEVDEIPRTLSVEILEKAFNILRYLGVRIMVNNFGTGVFPFHYLKDFKIDFLKLDPSLTIDIEKNEMAKALIDGIVCVANKMQMEVVCQEVANDAQKKLLTNLGCRLLSGQLVGNYLTEEQVLERFSQKVFHE